MNAASVNALCKWQCTVQLAMHCATGNALCFGFCYAPSSPCHQLFNVCYTATMTHGMCLLCMSVS